MDNISVRKMIIISGICISVAIFGSSVVMSRAALKVAGADKHRITVNGSAQKIVQSDFAVWAGECIRRGNDLPALYRKVGEDLAKVKKYLTSHGFGEKDIIVYRANREPFYKQNDLGNDTHEIQGYELTQVVAIRSKDIEKLKNLSRESLELINDGVEFDSASPDYFYTRLNDLKPEMFAEATAEAKRRATRMTKAAGQRIGPMRSAKEETFQVAPVDSAEPKDSEITDTDFPEKKITATVETVFEIE